jgi:hypothetical protein
MAGESGLITPKGVVPHTDNDETLGIPPLRWKTLYVNSISDGSGTIAVSDLTYLNTLKENLDGGEVGQIFTNTGPGEGSWQNLSLGDVLNDYATTTALEDGLAAKADASALDDYATTTAMNTALAAKANTTDVASTYATKTELADKADADDLDDYATTEALEDGLDGKADLVDGKVPTDQLPVELISQTWDVESIDDLVTLTDAHINDYAHITEGDDEGKVFVLAKEDPTVATNWIDITGSGGVVSVNGKQGAVTLDLADFENIIEALAAKAPLASPALTGTPTAPTATAGTSTTQIATTAFVQTAIGGVAVQDTITGDGVKTSWVIEHDKNSTRVFVQTYSVATKRSVYMITEITDANSVTLSVPEPLEDGYSVIVNILAF